MISEIYQTGKKLANGSHEAVIYALEHAGQHVAVKVSPVRHEGDRRALWREVEIHKALTHPHIVQYVSHFQLEQHVGLVIELCDHDLHEIVNVRRGIKQHEALRYFGELVSAVGYLHTRRIAHLDIKLENILIQQGTLKLADFGHAHYFYPGECLRQRLGTLSYMAPELHHTPVEAEMPPLDIYAMGMVLFVSIVGRYPFPSEGYAKSIVKNEVVVPRWIESRIRKLLSDLLNRDPKARPNVEALAQRARSLCEARRDQTVSGQ